MSYVTNKKLAELAEIAIGYQHRERISHAEHGSHRLIQVKDVTFRDATSPPPSIDPEDATCGWRLDIESLDRVTPKGDPSRYRIQLGDILFVCRGSSNIAIPLSTTHVQPNPDNWNELIPAYVFYILRPKPNLVHFEYLAWYINQPPAQAYFNRQARGTLVQVLPKSVFEELEVPIPDQATQHRICQLEHLRAREAFLLERLKIERSKLIQEHCLAAVQPTKNPLSKDS